MNVFITVMGWTMVAITLLVIPSAALAYGMGVVHFYGTGVQIGPVFVDWLYLTGPDSAEWWFPGRNN